MITACSATSMRRADSRGSEEGPGADLGDLDREVPAAVSRSCRGCRCGRCCAHRCARADRRRCAGTPRRRRVLAGSCEAAGASVGRRRQFAVPRSVRSKADLSRVIAWSSRECLVGTHRASRGGPFTSGTDTVTEIGNPIYTTRGTQSSPAQAPWIETDPATRSFRPAKPRDDHRLLGAPTCEAREQQVEQLQLVITADDRFRLGASVRRVRVRECAHDPTLLVLGRLISAR